MSEIQAVIQLLADNPLPEEPAAAAKAFDEMGIPAAADVQVEDLTVGAIACQRHTPPGADSSRMMMYLHGGGYVFGSLKSHQGLVAELARAANSQALAVDYRLAPKHQFPAAVEDALAAYQWLLAQGYAANKIFIAGDSAGGGLAVATLVALREQGIALPSGAACLSPWIDLEGLGDSMTSRADRDPILNADLLRHLGTLYAPNDLKSPTASPLYADLTGLPPLLIQVGEAEALFSDAERLYKNAQAAGVDATFEEWDDMIHVWHAFFPMLADARKAITRIGEFALARN